MSLVLRAPCRRNITRISYCFLQNPDPVFRRWTLCLGDRKQHPSTSLQTVSWISFSNFISFSGNSGEMDLWKPGPVLLDSGKYPFGLSSPSRRRCPALENEDGLTVQLVAQAAQLFKSFLLGPSGPGLGPFRLSKGCAGRYWFFKRERGNRKAKAGGNESLVRWA